MNHPGAESAQRRLPRQIARRSCQMDAEQSCLAILRLYYFCYYYYFHWTPSSVRGNDWSGGKKEKKGSLVLTDLARLSSCNPRQFVCVARVGSPRNISLSFSSKQTRHISLALATINLWCRDQSRCRLGKILSVLGDTEVSEARWGVSGWRGTRTPCWRSAASANTDLSISMVVWSVVGIPV